MPTEELPTLDHGIPPPETYLPGTPVWYWWVLGVSGIFILLLLYWAYRLLKPAPKPPAPQKEDLFLPTMASLENLETSCGTELVSTIAAKASLAIRAYLADSRSEPALYETSEEFHARHGILPAKANAFLNELADAKYARSGIDEEKSKSLIARSRNCLKDLDRTDPEKTAPPRLPETKRHFSEWIPALFPIGIAIALGAFLFDLYDGTDTGTEIKMNPVTWIALFTATSGLLAKLISRPQS